MVNLYVRLIRNEKIDFTIEDVPEIYREAVKAKLEKGNG
jgi:hypothetical protein